MSLFRPLVVALAVIVTAIMAPALSAQDLQSGTWTGEIIMPDGNSVDVMYEVASTADSLGITIAAGPMGTFKTSNIELSDKELAFDWQPGPVVFCALKKKANGSYEGACAPEGDEEGIMIMNPPKDKK